MPVLRAVLRSASRLLEDGAEVPMCSKPSLVAVVVLSLFAIVSPASAQDEAREPVVTLEVQARLGGGVMFTNLEDGASLPATSDGGIAGDGAFGAVVGARHAGTGLGAVAAYTHSFTGVSTHFGMHTYEGRVSERLSLHRRGRFELSLLVEAGAYFMEGGGHLACPWLVFSGSDTCTAVNVDVQGVGGVGALGLTFRYHVLLAGFEVDYRHTEGTRGPLASQDDFQFLGRIGVAFDL